MSSENDRIYNVCLFFYLFRCKEIEFNKLAERLGSYFKYEITIINIRPTFEKDGVVYGIFSFLKNVSYANFPKFETNNPLEKPKIGFSKSIFVEQACDNFHGVYLGDTSHVSELARILFNTDNFDYIRNKTLSILNDNEISVVVGGHVYQYSHIIEKFENKFLKRHSNHFFPTVDKKNTLLTNFRLDFRHVSLSQFKCGNKLTKFNIKFILNSNPYNFVEFFPKISELLDDSIRARMVNEMLIPLELEKVKNLNSIIADSKIDSKILSVSDVYWLLSHQ